MSEYVTDAFEEIAHSLRILVEAYIGSKDLMKIDPDEAVGNIEHALTASLNAFASLFDAIMKEQRGNSIDWYEIPELAIILILRNARHHNHAKKIRTVYSYYMQEDKYCTNSINYLFVKAPTLQMPYNFKIMEIYISWGDFSRLLEMSRKESKIHDSTKRLVQIYMNSENISAYAKQNEVTAESVFVDIVPLIINAGIKATSLIKDLVKIRSCESDEFLNLFSDDLMPIDICKHEFSIHTFSQ